MRPQTTQEEINMLKQKIESENDVTVNVINGKECSILGLVGDTTKVDADKIRANEFVENVEKVQQPYKLSNRLFHPDDTVIKVKNASIGGDELAVIAGPCSVESEEQIVKIAQDVKKKWC